MWKFCLVILLIAPAYAQVFTEDLAKINHYLSEKELERFLEKPTPEGIPSHYLSSLVAREYLDPFTNCEDQPWNYRPQRYRYEVLLISEDVPTQETTVVLAKYELVEEEHAIVTEAKKIMESQKDHPGMIEKTFSHEESKKIIHYVNPNTEVVLKTNLRGENKLTIDMEKLNDENGVNSNIKFDVVNRLDVKQVITDSTELKGSIEAGHTTGKRDLSSLDGMSFQLDQVKTEARLNQEITPRVKSYTEVSYTHGLASDQIRTIAGLDIKAPQNSHLIVFTGHSVRQNKDHSRRDEESEMGVEYRTKTGTKFFGRVRDSESGTTYEAGVEVKLGD